MQKQKWTLRILLEAESVTNTAFVTLTYSEAHVPSKGSLVKRDATLFLKRLRKSLGYRISYFLVGEYGSKSLRPHYHLMLFGLRPEHWVQVEKSWGLGFVTVSEFTRQRASYIVGYTLKKMTSPRSFTDGRIPEFATMSRRPALGQRFIEKIGQSTDLMNTYLDGETVSLRLDGRHYALDPFLAGKLREFGIVRIDPEVRHYVQEQRTRSKMEKYNHAKAEAFNKRCAEKVTAREDKNLNPV